MNEAEFITKVTKSKGTSGGWPANLNYEISGTHIAVELNKGFTKKDFRRLDSWGLAFLSDAELSLDRRIKSLNFLINGASAEACEYNFESFMRRVSFLNINNDIDIKVVENGNTKNLYDHRCLFNRPDAEIIRIDKGIEKRSDDKPGRIEKDFQTFLFGNGLKVDANTNERLAVLGEDFFNLKKKGFKILREFPTGVFDKKISNNARILPTEYVDIVTLNKWGELSVIELKLNDSQLEVISQILDYALFFSCYFKQLLPYLKKHFVRDNMNEKLICYVVNNRFHPNFEKILGYYGTAGKPYNFELRKVTLGFTKKI